MKQSSFNSEPNEPDNEIQGLIGALKAWIINPNYDHRHYTSERNFTQAKKLALATIPRRGHKTLGFDITPGKTIQVIKSRATGKIFRIKYL